VITYPFLKYDMQDIYAELTNVSNMTAFKYVYFIDMDLDYINSEFTLYQISTKNFLVFISLLFLIYYFWNICYYIRKKKVSPEQTVFILMIISLPFFNDPFSIFTLGRKGAAFFSIFGQVFVTEYFALILYIFAFLTHRISEGPQNNTSFHRWYLILGFIIFALLMVVFYAISYKEVDSDPSFQFFSLSAHSSSSLAIAVLLALLFFAYLALVVFKMVMSVR